MLAGVTLGHLTDKPRPAANSSGQLAKGDTALTVKHDTTSAVATVRPPIVAKAPPKFMPGQQVVLRGYEDGWQWAVVDAEVLRRKDPFWSYTVEAIRPYDLKVVRSMWPEWKLRPAPEAAR